MTPKEQFKFEHRAARELYRCALAFQGRESAFHEAGISFLPPWKQWAIVMVAIKYAQGQLWEDGPRDAGRAIERLTTYKGALS